MVVPAKQKSALVLLHGFCEDNSLWNEIIPNLHFKGEIIALNLPGFGGTQMLKAPFSIADVATSIYNNLKQRGVLNCICIGHSLGGYVALALKKSHPTFVKQLGLVHSTSYADSPYKKEARNTLIKFLNRQPSSSFLSTFAPSLFCEPNATKLQKEIKKVIAMSAGLESTTIQAYAVAMRDREDNRKILAQQEAPFFFSGNCDQAISPKDSHSQISTLKNKENCYLVDKVAHMGMYECPSILIEAINKFIGNNQLAIG